jgi:hypothetical protein
MTAKCLALVLLAGFDVDLGEETEGRGGREVREDGEAAEVEAKGWFEGTAVVGCKSEVLRLRLRFIPILLFVI